MPGEPVDGSSMKGKVLIASLNTVSIMNDAIPTADLIPWGSRRYL
jgi:hypothetical protein